MCRSRIIISVLKQVLIFAIYIVHLSNLKVKNPASSGRGAVLEYLCEHLEYRICFSNLLCEFTTTLKFLVND